MTIKKKYEDVFLFEDLIYDVKGMKNEIARHRELYPVLTAALDDTLFDQINKYEKHDPERLHSISQHKLNEPVIGVQIDHQQIRIVDGHYRLKRKYDLKLKYFRLYLFPMDIAYRFVNKRT